MLFQLVQIVYWLALATWFGGVLFVAIAAPVIFRTIGERNPVLPGVLSVNLEGQHGTLLAGEIVGNLLVRVSQVALICGAALAVTLVVHFFVIDLTGTNLGAAILRWLLLAAAGGIAFYQWYVIWPRVERNRQEYVEHADEPEVANPAKERFDAEHRRSVLLLQAMLFLLLGMILFSGSITPRRTFAPAAAPQGQSLMTQPHAQDAIQDLA